MASIGCMHYYYVKTSVLDIKQLTANSWRAVISLRPQVSLCQVVSEARRQPSLICVCILSKNMKKEQNNTFTTCLPLPLSVSK